jgi:catechol 2,3-dioxygenase-like lactoylglutathione lyase family enzyme
MCSNRQEEIAEFYREAFGLTEVFRHRSAANGRLAVYLTDGETNLAIIPAMHRTEGINHFGFQVDDVAATSDAALAAGAAQGAIRVPQDGRQNEAFIKDPINQRVDLSSSGWHHDGTGRAHIRHLAIMADDPPKLADFYMRIFGLHDVMRDPGIPAAVELSDGHINVAILPNDRPESLGAPAGVHHFGFAVNDLDGTLGTAYAHGAQRAARDVPRVDRFAETFVFDPQGQRVDLSAAGWRT